MPDASRSSAPPPAGSDPPAPGTDDTIRGGALGERAIAATGAGLRRLGRWVRRFAGECLRAPRQLDFEQRVAGIGALLLIVSTFGPFSFVEAAIVLVALAVLLLLKKRADGRSFHLPFGDGAVIMAAGAWSAMLIVVRLLDRPLGQNLLAIVCAAILALAGLRMRLRRPADDLPQERKAAAGAPPAPAGGVAIEFAEQAPQAPEAPPEPAATAALPRDEELTEALPEPAPQRAVRPRTPAASRPLPPAPAAEPAQAQPDPDFDLPAAPEPEEAAPPQAPPDGGPFRARPATPSDAPPPSQRVPRPRPRQRDR
jgi:hypothetical protein